MRAIKFIIITPIEIQTLANSGAHKALSLATRTIVSLVFMISVSFSSKFFCKLRNYTQIGMA